MSASGWIKVWRDLWHRPGSGTSLRDRPGTKARRREAWLWLLSQVNHRDNPHHQPPLLEGQVALSRGDICAYTCWSDGEAKAWLKALEADGRITRDSAGRTTVITVVNWPIYQHEIDLDPGPGQVRVRSGSGPDDGQDNCAEHNANSDVRSGSGPGQVRVRSGLGPATTEEGRRKKEEERDTRADARSAPASPPDLSTKTGREVAYPKLRGRKALKPWPESFEHFWAAFPAQNRGSDRIGAYAYWRDAVVDGTDPDHLVTAARTYGERCDKDRRMPLGPKKWLANRSWEDLPPPGAPPREPGRPPADPMGIDMWATLVPN